MVRVLWMSAANRITRENRPSSVRVALLAIVGASHRGYDEAYLDPKHDVRLVDAAGALR